MRVLMIGGSGFIGSRVTRRLLDRGHAVTVFHRGGTPPPTGASEILGSEEGLADHATRFARLEPDVVVHMLLGTEAQASRFARVFEGLSLRGVVVSSMDVYRAYDRYRRKEPGPPDPVPLSEDAPLRERRYPYRTPDDADDYDKILVEERVAAAQRFPCAVLRLPMVYGPGDPLHRFHGFVRRMDDGRAAIVLDQGRAGWRGSYGYVDDVAKAIALAATDRRATGRTYNVGEPQAVPTREWVGRLARTTGWRGRIVVPPRHLVPPVLLADRDYAQDWEVATGRIRTELGYHEECDLEEALAATVAWERDHPPAGGVPPAAYAAEDLLLNRMGG